MSIQDLPKYWTVKRALPFSLRDRGSFHFVQQHHLLYLEPGDVGIEVCCCDSGVADRGTPPPEEHVLRRLPGFTSEQLGGGHLLLRGQARIEGVTCDVEIFVSAHSERLYGSIHRASSGSNPIGDDDATGVWTAEDDGGEGGGGRGDQG